MRRLARCAVQAVWLPFYVAGNVAAFVLGAVEEVGGVLEELQYRFDL